MPKVDKSKLSKDELLQLEQWEHSRDQAKSLQELLTETQKLNELVKDSAAKQAVGQMLGLIQSELAALKPSTVTAIDLAPVVEAVESLGKKLKVEAPIVNVPTPKVTVKPADVNIDTEGIVKAVKAQKFPTPLPAVASEGSVIYRGDRAYPVKRVPIDVLTAGITPILEGRVAVISCFVMAADDTEITFLDKDGGRHSGDIDVRRAPGFVWPRNEDGWIEADGLYVEQQKSVKLGGLLTYIEA